MTYTLRKLSSRLLHLIPASSARAQTRADISSIPWKRPTPLPWKRLALMTDNDKHFYVTETPLLLFFSCFLIHTFSSQKKKLTGQFDSGVNVYGHGDLLHVVTAKIHNKQGRQQPHHLFRVLSLFCWPFLRNCSASVWLVWRIWQHDIEPFPEWAGTAG